VLPKTIVEIEVVDVEELRPLLDHMGRILFSTKTLTHDDRRDLENLLSLIEDQLRKQTWVIRDPYMDKYF
jgi:hypothetical protein